MKQDKIREATVDRNAAVPLYHQIFTQLRDEIVSGVRPYGAPVPTEQELSDNFSVSRITARRALQELASQGFVVRKRRIGSHVSYRTPTRPLEASLTKAVDSLLTFGRSTRVTVKQIATGPVGPAVARLLDIDPQTPMIRGVRIRWLDNEPLGYVVSFVPTEMGDIVTQNSLEEKPILELLRDAGLKVDAAQQIIAATAAEPHIAQDLKVDVLSPLLRITRSFTDAQGKPLLLTQAHYRADRYHIKIDLQAEAMGFAVGIDDEI